MNLLGLAAAAGTSKIKLVIISFIIAAVLTSAAGFALYVRSLQNNVAELTEEKNNLTAANSILKDDVKVLRENVKALATANHSNYLTAQSLIADKAASTKAISNLAAMRTADKVGFDRLYNRIEIMLKDPKNDGQVAPVLREVLREIQKERDKK